MMIGKVGRMEDKVGIRVDAEGIPLHIGRSTDLKGLYESSRAVTTVDGLPPAPSLGFAHGNGAKFNFGGPAGGSAPGRRFATKSDITWLVETEKSEVPS